MESISAVCSLCGMLIITLANVIKVQFGKRSLVQYSNSEIYQIRNKHKGIYDRLRKLAADKGRRFFVFANEHHR